MTRRLILVTLMLTFVACHSKKPVATTARSTSTATSITSTTAATESTTTAARATAPAAPHVMVIVLENREYGDVIGNDKAPFINDLAHRYGNADSVYATTHPSLPNYLELISGSTHGITSDCTSCNASGPNLATQLTKANISWAAFLEGMPAACSSAATAPGGYAKKHNPFAYFPDLMNDRAQCANLMPATEFAQQINRPSPPAFVWYTPNLCNDGHDCGIGTTDHWLQQQLDQIMKTPWYAADGTIIVTWDEGTSGESCCQHPNGGGHIATVVVADRLHGAHRSDPVSQAGILRSIEDAYHLDHLGDADCPCRGDLRPLL